jgi:cytochrome c553
MRILTSFALLVSFCLAPATIQAQELEFPAVAKPCITCHGRDGRGRSPGFPNLCGQKSIYVMQQLTMFRDKMRQSEVMNITTENLTNDDIRAIAEYYEAQPACK